MVWLYGEIINKQLRTEFVILDDRKFEKYELDVTNILSSEELIERISGLILNENYLYEIVLVGNRSFEVNAREILKLIENQNVLKIKDNTQLSIDIEELSKENNLRGMFVREVIKKYQDGNYTEEQIKKAIELGLSVM